MSKYKDSFYEIAPLGSKYRQLGAILFRAYKEDPEKAYKILMRLKDKEVETSRLLKYLDRRMSPEHKIAFTDFFMKYRIIISSIPGLEQIYKDKDARLSRQLGDVLYRVYGDNPDKIYEVLKSLPNDKDVERLLKYIHKPYIKTQNVIKDFVNTYMLYRVTLQEPRLKQVAMQNNLALLYPDLDPTSREARLKAMRSIKSYQHDDSNDETTVQTPTNMFQTIVSHTKEKFEHLK